MKCVHCNIGMTLITVSLSKNNISMKKITIFGILAFFTAAMTFFACTPEEDDVRLDPQLSTMKVVDITSDSATIVGFVVAEGDGFTERGVVYDVTEDLTIESNKVVFSDSTEDKSQFSVTIGGLDYATMYFARVYAIGTAGAIYGDTVSFSTLPESPTLTTAEITAITGNSATGGGNVTNNGGAPVTMKGVCFGTGTAPTVDSTITENGDGLGAFVSELIELDGNTVYYVRAYATNSAGTGYGPEVSFTTLKGLPTVTTTAVTEVSKISAVSGGEVTGDGGGTISERGLVWALTADPTTDDTKIMDGSPGIGIYVSNIAGLTLSTTYNVRAYAINSAGTAYGDNISFTTLADITKLWAVGDYNGWDNSDNAEFITSTATSNGAAEGYIYLTSGGIKLVTDHSWGDASTFGDDGSGGLTNPGGNIPVSEDGYYLVQANLGDMTYLLTKTDWGVIGDATPGLWDNDTDLSYVSASKTWRGSVTLSDAGAYKFRANDGWDIDYGSTAADGMTLDAGGENIPSPGVIADYAMELDLSTPNEYMYSSHRWGVIGAATPGSWDNDTDLTWDADNMVFTVTLDLVIGEWKFRADDDWAVNYGGAIGALTQDGGNLAVAEDGNYTITLDPWDGIGTITKN